MSNKLYSACPVCGALGIVNEQCEFCGNTIPAGNESNPTYDSRIVEKRTISPAEFAKKISIYHKVGVFSAGCAIASIGSLSGLINLNGDIILPIEHGNIQKDGRWAFIDGELMDVVTWTKINKSLGKKWTLDHVKYFEDDNLIAICTRTESFRYINGYREDCYSNYMTVFDIKENKSLIVRGYDNKEYKDWHYPSIDQVENGYLLEDKEYLFYDITKGEAIELGNVDELYDAYEDADYIGYEVRDGKIALVSKIFGDDEDESRVVAILDTTSGDLKSQVEAIKRKISNQDTTTSGINNQNTTNPGNSGCYIATAVYGTYDCPEVWTLRRFRDNTLDETWYGRQFIKAYYAVSPALVEWFGDAEWFRRIWRGFLDSLILRLKEQGVEDTPYNDKY